MAAVPLPEPEAVDARGEVLGVVLPVGIVPLRPGEVLAAGDVGADVADAAPEPRAASPPPPAAPAPAAAAASSAVPPPEGRPLACAGGAGDPGGGGSANAPTPRAFPPAPPSPTDLTVAAPDALVRLLQGPDEVLDARDTRERSPPPLTLPPAAAGVAAVGRAAWHTLAMAGAPTTSSAFSNALFNTPSRCVADHSACGFRAASRDSLASAACNRRSMRCAVDSAGKPLGTPPCSAASTRERRTASCVAAPSPVATRACSRPCISFRTRLAACTCV